jgi:hypothetical protein
MIEPRRPLHLLKPDALESFSTFERLVAILADLNPSVLSSDDLQSGFSIGGSVLLIPPGPWRPGVISDLTRFSDLSIVALISGDESSDRVDLWYMLGAALVLDDHASTGVLRSAVLKLLELELSSLRQQLTRKENLLFDVLRRAGKSGLDRTALAEKIWNDVTIQSNTIDVHIFNLRRKLNSSRFRIVYESRRFVMVENLQINEIPG